ncbi:MAG: hypothetical protein WAV23_03165 [Minisyncoccia bacterium]
MKKHYYFTQGVVKYKIEKLFFEEKKQVTYELTQEPNLPDREFFLGVAGDLRRELKKSFLESRPQIKEDQVISTDICVISKLN